MSSIQEGHVGSLQDGAGLQGVTPAEPPTPPDPPALINDFFPNASQTIDQASGATYTVSTAPTFTAGLGGLTYMTNGAVYVDLGLDVSGGMPFYGASVYFLIARVTVGADPEGANYRTLGGMFESGNGNQSQYFQGRIDVATDRAQLVSNNAFISAGPVVPEGATAQKSVLSIHHVPTSGGKATQEIRVDGVAVSSGEFTPNYTLLNVLGVGAEFIFFGNSNRFLQQLYRVRYYSTGVYDSSEKDFLLALLP